MRKQQQVIRINNKTVPAEIWIKSVHYQQGVRMVSIDIYPENEIDLRKRDAKGELVIQPQD